MGFNTGLNLETSGNTLFSPAVVPIVLNPTFTEGQIVISAGGCLDLDLPLVAMMQHSIDVSSRGPNQGNLSMSIPPTDSGRPVLQQALVLLHTFIS